MMLSTPKIVTAGLMILTAGLAGAGLVIHQALAERPLQDNSVTRPPEKRAQQPPAKTTTPKPPSVSPPDAGGRHRGGADEQDTTKIVAFAGRVVDPDGKPVKDAKLFITTYRNFKLQPPKVRAVSDDDGKYRFTVPTGEFDTSRSPEPWKYTLVLAMADGYGLGLPQYDFSKWSEPFPIDNLTINLAKDDVPINGRVLDLQAKPIAGVKIHVRGIQWPHKGDLTSFLAALKTRKEGFSVQQELLVGIRHPHRGEDLDNLYPPVVTDADGRFRIKGSGRERVADLLIEGPTIETKLVYAMTRPSETIDVPYLRQPTPGQPRDGEPLPMAPMPQYTHYGATFVHVAPPSKPVVGVVRDKETGKPIPGAVIGSYALASNQFDERVSFRVVADKDGRYRITGLPYGKGNQIQAGGPPEGKPYVMAIKNVGTSPALEPITGDIELKRGVWINGKVTDKVSGKPVRCQYDYFAFEDNPHLKDAPQFTTGPQDDRITEDGRFRLVGLPGHGVIAVRAFDDNYLHGVGREGIKGAKDVPEHSYFKASPYFFYPNNYHAVAEINPDKDAESLTCNLVLDPGRILTGTVLGPDGKPLAGAFAHGLSGMPNWNYPALDTAEFKLMALKPGEPRRLLVVHKERRLAGTLLLRGDEKGPLTIKLEPWGVVTGKLVTPERKGSADYQIMTFSGIVMTPEGEQQRDLDVGDLLQPVKPDKDGKFRIEGLVPGLKYNLLIGRGSYVARIFGPETTEVTVKSGETKDIGELRVKSIDE